MSVIQKNGLMNISQKNGFDIKLEKALCLFH